jgi:hypothetical protein
MSALWSAWTKTSAPGKAGTRCRRRGHVHSRVLARAGQTLDQRVLVHMDQDEVVEVSPCLGPRGPTEGGALARAGQVTGCVLRVNPVLDSPGPLSPGADRGEDRPLDRAVDR